ncbi:MAG: ABC transporter permease subunit [Clostridiaceae bacterium]|nr:ABC transporter permease subunit [Clostridiaceae bacterium]
MPNLAMRSAKKSRPIIDVKRLKKSWQLYFIIFLPLAFILLFHYGPMYGIQIAFKDYDVTAGIWKSEWVGLKNFTRFIGSYNFKTIVWNTISISLYSLILGLPIPIMLAISLNECEVKWYKKLVQTVTYAPHFISMVVMVSMIILSLSLNNGIINNIVATLGGERVNFMSKPELFKTIYIISGIWQGMGYSAILYLAVLTGIDPNLYEAALIDGASRFKKIIYIDLPFLVPTIIIMLILSLGSVMNVGFEKIYLMQNKLNLSASETISTYVYKIGIENANFSYSTVISLFNSVVNMMMIIIVNYIARKVSETSLW